MEKTPVFLSLGQETGVLLVNTPGVVSPLNEMLTHIFRR
jgi:hypothetical protein